MSVPVYIDVRKPFPFGDYVAETSPQHGYQLTRSVMIDLGTTAFHGLKGEGFRVAGCHLRADQGVWWNGSNVVPDRPSCLLASFVHDMLCEGIHHKRGITAWRRFSLRRDADLLYARVCRWQGMWTGLALIRFIGLRLATPWVVLKSNREKTPEGTHCNA